MEAHTGTFLFLTTDTQVLGILAWFSGVLSLLGIGVAIVQATGAKSAAEAAKTAAQEMKRTVQSRESLVELIAAQAHLKSAKDHLGRGTIEAADIYINLLRTALAQARALMVDDVQEQKRVRTLIVRIAAVAEEVTALTKKPSEKREAMPSILELTKVSGVLDEITARRRYTYEPSEVEE